MRISRDNFLTRLKARDERALEFVLEEYGGLLMSVIRRHLACLPQMQEECLNDVLFSIWEHIAQFDETRSTFKNWIAGIARYRSITYLRKYKNHLEELSLDAGCADDPGAEDTALLALIDRELSEETERILDCLKAEDRSLFLKLYCEGQDVEAISRETGLKKATIYQKVARGKKKIISLRNKEAN